MNKPDGNRYEIRIKEYKLIKASELVPNEENFRIHPGLQQDAIRGIMGDVGWVDAVKVYETSDGQYKLIDGHLRQGLEPDDMIPVLVTDINEEEARKILASHDHIATLATIDEDKLQALVHSIHTDDAALDAMIESLKKEAKIAEDSGGDDKPEEGGPPGMELSPHEHYDFVVVLARTTQDWSLLTDLLGIEDRRNLATRKSKVGMCRAITADKLIEVILTGKVAAEERESHSASEAPK